MGAVEWYKSHAHSYLVFVQKFGQKRDNYVATQHELSIALFVGFVQGWI